MNGNTDYIGGHSCIHGHVFIYAGTLLDGKIPEGYPCLCGLYVSHWIKCPTCGQDKLELIMLVLLVAMAGCSTMSYESKEGTKVTYSRLFTGADARVTMPDGTVIESQGQGLDANSLVGAILKK